MKKCFWIVILALFITGCSLKKEKFVPGTLDGETNIKEISDIITLTIDEESVTAKGLSFTLTNNSDITYHLGNAFKIEKKQDDKWYKLKMDGEMMIALSLRSVDPGDAVPFNIEWWPWYGELPKGEYRIVMDFYELEKARYYTAAEFSIE